MVFILTEISPVKTAVSSFIQSSMKKLGFRIVKILNQYDYQNDAEKCIEIVKAYTMMTWEALVTLYQQVRWCEQNSIKGDFVECGVWKGGSLGLMALCNLNSAQARRNLHGFDNFDDGCEPDPAVDGKDILNQTSRLSGEMKEKFSGALKPVKGIYDSLGGAGSLSEVKNLLEKKIAYPNEYIHLHQGWFEHTVPGFSQQKKPIAILHLDCGLYRSTKVCLEQLYESVIENGFIIVDDYGTYEGCRKAVDEFLSKLRKPVYLHHVNQSTRYWIKA